MQVYRDAFATLTSKLLASERWTKRVDLDRYAFLRQAGDCDTNIYYMDKGSIRAYLISHDVEQIIRFGYSGEIILSLQDFITQRASQLYIQALRSTRLRMMSRSVYYEVVNGDSELLAAWSLVKDYIILQHIEREEDILVNSPAERYRRVRDRSPRLFQEVPNKYIANYLRMTPETLSRVMNS